MALSLTAIFGSLIKDLKTIIANPSNSGMCAYCKHYIIFTDDELINHYKECPNVPDGFYEDLVEKFDDK